ncbi:hypothetical protein JAAARDRAFT_200736 [Jaapia argillacea MUCL 33604]|uniref:Uncharacterized protein n=1 Tax=Jaapia argillacea MUCL 33604 TaxID=933084 RepID=A0A067P6Y4_9AGAM|nr:hypothetical protein JAAARDRAFT_200736 [Jaapia argillacea MUCL 33604]
MPSRPQAPRPHLPRLHISSHRIRETFYVDAELTGLGYTTISTYTPHSNRAYAPNRTNLNDLIPTPQYDLDLPFLSIPASRPSPGLYRTSILGSHETALLTNLVAAQPDPSTDFCALDPRFPATTVTTLNVLTRSSPVPRLVTGLLTPARSADVLDNPRLEYISRNDNNLSNLHEIALKPYPIASSDTESTLGVCVNVKFRRALGEISERKELSVLL